MSMMIELTAMVALVAAFVVLLTKKWGIDEWMQVHGDKFMSRLFSCDFCMSFWACVIASLVLYCWSDDPKMLTIPFFATPITRMLV